MPLKKGRSRKVVSENIREFHTGKTYQRTARKFGKKRADAQAVAAALHSAGKSKPRKPSAARPAKKKDFWS